MGADWANRTSHNFYVYTLAYPDETVFYVGKGCGKRIDDHERLACKGHASLACDVIRSLWMDNKDILKSKIYTGLTWNQAVWLEQATIDLYGMQHLVNKIADTGMGTATNF